MIALSNNLMYVILRSGEGGITDGHRNSSNLGTGEVLSLVSSEPCEVADHAVVLITAGCSPLHADTIRVS